MQFSLLPDFLRAKTNDPVLDQISPLIDDAAIDDQLAAYYPSFSIPQGRPPYWPSCVIRMHLVFFLKRINKRFIYFNFFNFSSLVIIHHSTLKKCDIFYVSSVGAFKDSVTY